MVDFYNQINLLYGAITEFCSPQSCPEMKATDEYGHPLLIHIGNVELTLLLDSNTCGKTMRTIKGRPRCQLRRTSSSS